MTYMITMVFLEDIGRYFLKESVLANFQSLFERSNCDDFEKRNFH